MGTRESAQSGPKLRFLDYAPIHTVDNSSFAYFICHLSGIVGEGPCNSGFVNMAHPSCTSVVPSFSLFTNVQPRLVAFGSRLEMHH